MPILDLSHPMTNGQPSYPGDPPLVIAPHNTIAEDGYNLTRLEMGSHQGTHLDAPYHFDEDGLTLDRMPLEWFYGPASMIDLAPGGCLPAGTELTAEMFRPFEGLFAPGARILYRTGWDRWFGQAAFFEDFPSLTPDAVRWIAAHQISLLGMDTPSPSVEAVYSHGVLLAKGNETVIVESLTNLDRLPAQFIFMAFPLNLVGR
ncbi:MAG: cyclase family protein, partial [Armatimonadota bacterium]|nr:cyclase family protein [Armatimonadota bacterium]